MNYPIVVKQKVRSRSHAPKTVLWLLLRRRIFPTQGREPKHTFLTNVHLVLVYSILRRTIILSHRSLKRKSEKWGVLTNYENLSTNYTFKRHISAFSHKTKVCRGDSRIIHREPAILHLLWSCVTVDASSVRLRLPPSPLAKAFKPESDFGERI